jgi:hypothetical protein
MVTATMERREATRPDVPPPLASVIVPVVVVEDVAGGWRIT